MNGRTGGSTNFMQDEIHSVARHSNAAALVSPWGSGSVDGRKDVFGEGGWRG